MSKIYKVLKPFSLAGDTAEKDTFIHENIIANDVNYLIGRGYIKQHKGDVPNNVKTGTSIANEQNSQQYKVLKPFSLPSASNGTVETDDVIDHVHIANDVNYLIGRGYIKIVKKQDIDNTPSGDARSNLDEQYKTLFGKYPAKNMKDKTKNTHIANELKERAKSNKDAPDSNASGEDAPDSNAGGKDAPNSNASGEDAPDSNASGEDDQAPPALDGSE